MTFFLAVEKNELANSMKRLYNTRERLNLVDLSRISFYGVSVGTSQDAEVFFDDLNGLELSAKGYRDGFVAETSLSVEDARRIKNTTGAVLLAQFEEPFAESYLGKGQFKIHLKDVQFFDRQTGKVLARLNRVSPIDAALTPQTEQDGPLGKAHQLHKLGRDNEALSELYSVVRKEPTNPEAYLLLGRINLKRGDHEASISALKTAIFWDPKLIDAHLLLAKIFLARGNRAEASKYLNSALSIDPDNEEARSLQHRIPK